MRPHVLVGGCAGLGNNIVVEPNRSSYGFYFRGCAEAYPAVIERRHFQCLKYAWVNCYIVPYIFSESKDVSHCWLHTTYVFSTHAPCVPTFQLKFRTCQMLISSVSSVLLSKTNCCSFILLCFCRKVCWMRTHAPCVPTCQLKFRPCQMLISSVSSVLLSKKTCRSFILLCFCRKFRWMRTHAPCVPTFQLKFHTCQMLIPSVSFVLLSKTNWRSFILLFFCLNPPP